MTSKQNLALFILFFLWIPVARAEQDKNLHDPDKAAVSWTLYNDRYDFQKSPTVSRRYFESIGVCSENYIQVPIDADLNKKGGTRIYSFEDSVSSVLEQLKDSKEPVLYINITGHGNKGEFGRQACPKIIHKDFLDTLFQTIESFESKTKKEVILRLYIGACHSGSLVPPLKERIQVKEGKFTDGKDRYNRRIDILTSAPAELPAQLNNYLEYHISALQRVQAKLKEAFDEQAHLPAICFPIGNDRPQIWSSYHPQVELSPKDLARLLAVIDSRAHRPENQFNIQQENFSWGEQLRDSAAPQLLRLFGGNQQKLHAALKNQLANGIDVSARRESAQQIARLNLQEPAMIRALIEGLRIAANGSDSDPVYTFAKSLAKYGAKAHEGVPLIEDFMNKNPDEDPGGSLRFFAKQMQ